MGNSKSGYGLSDVSNSKTIPAPEFPYMPSLPPSYRPAIGLIGCGGISEYHLQAYRDLGLTVAALCDSDIQKAQDRRDEFYPEASVFTDYREILAQDDIEIVDIATHPAERTTIIEAALLAHKHVLSQKPFVFDLDVGERLAQLAQEQSCILAVNQNGRWAPHFSYLRHAVDNGLLGKIASVHFSLQWDHAWVAGTPYDDLRHLILMDFGIHWFDMCTVFFGNREALSVSAQVTHGLNHRTRAPMLAHVTVTYPDGQATLSFNGHVTHGQQDETVICGDHGTARSIGPSLSDQRVTLYTNEGQATPNLEGTWFTSGFQGAMTELLHAVDADRQPIHHAAGNLRSLALCFAALASADDEGRPKTPGTVRTGTP
ncbi:MAG: dehydrogenase [Candidatus Hydrogenedentota bacterium]|nr:MAG: dehydrogenase [Candidatus Hydrogenedentota bacterium]